MSLAKAALWTGVSTAIKIGAGLVVIKMLAMAYGPQGVGQMGNFRQLILVLGVLSGAGIFNGVTKYMAEFHAQPGQLRAIAGTSAAIVLLSSALLALLFWFGAPAISRALLDSPDYQSVIRGVALIQFAIALANLAQALLKGKRDARGNALTVIGGSLLGVIFYVICLRLGGYSGALIGLALVPAVTLLPGVIVLIRHRTLPLRWLIPCWDRVRARQLARFTVMALLTSVTLPVAYVMMRNLLAAHYSWHDVGLWQGVNTISNAYLQFITASFTVWLLPTLSRLTDKAALSREILRTLRFVMLLVCGASLLVWLLRDVAIRLLFSAQFSAMRDLFAWQLAGDVFKVGAYVFGYLIIAKASLRFYILTECSQFLLLTLFSRWLVPAHGATGAAQAYMATYAIYFAVCCVVFSLWRRRI